MMAEYVVQRERYYDYSPSLMAARIVNTIIGIIEFTLVLRIVLQLLGASTASSFVAWVYSVTDALMGPFLGAFDSWSIGYGAMDVSAIFAMIGYAILGWLVIRLLSLFVGPVEAI